MLHCESFPWGIVLQEQTAPTWVPHGSQVLPENVLLHGHLSTGYSSFKNPAPKWARESQLPSGHVHLLQREIPCGLQVDICFAMEIQGMQGDRWPHHVDHHRLQENLYASAEGIPPLPSLLTLLFAGQFHSCPHSSVPAAVFLPLLKYVIIDLLLLMDSAFFSSGSFLEVSGTGSVQQMGISCCHRSHIYSSPVSKTLLRKPGTQFFKTLLMKTEISKGHLYLSVCLSIPTTSVLFYLTTYMSLSSVR